MDSLPVVCKFCREPLRYVRSKTGALRLVEKASGDRHFLGDQCPIVKTLDRVTRAGTGR